MSASPKEPEVNPLDDVDFVRDQIGVVAGWARKQPYMSPRIKLAIGIVCGAALRNYPKQGRLL